MVKRPKAVANSRATKERSKPLAIYKNHNAKTVNYWKARHERYSRRKVNLGLRRLVEETKRWSTQSETGN